VRSGVDEEQCLGQWVRTPALVATPSMQTASGRTPSAIEPQLTSGDANVRRPPVGVRAGPPAHTAPSTGALSRTPLTQGGGPVSSPPPVTDLKCVCKQPSATEAGAHGGGQQGRSRSETAQCDPNGWHAYGPTRQLLRRASSACSATGTCMRCQWIAARALVALALVALPSCGDTRPLPAITSPRAQYPERPRRRGHPARLPVRTMSRMTAGDVGVPPPPAPDGGEPSVTSSVRVPENTRPVSPTTWPSPLGPAEPTLGPSETTAPPPPPPPPPEATGPVEPSLTPSHPAAPEPTNDRGRQGPSPT
jgi:hypothetical protein